MFRFLVVLSLSLMFFLIGGCTKPVATVDGKNISKEKLQMQIKERLREHKLQNASVDEKKMRDAILQELIAEQLVLNEAEAKGIKISDAEVNKEIETVIKKMGQEQYQKALKDRGLTPEGYRNRTKERMTIARFVENLVKSEDITEQQMMDFYKNSPKPFMKPARVNMKIVEFQTEEAANAAAAELAKTKTDFDEFASKLEAEKKASVTAYGWVSPDFFSPTMATSIKMLKDGQHGGPYKGKSGYYLVKVKEHQNESIASFEDVKDTIRATILQQKRSEAYEQWVNQKRKTAKISINIK